MYFFAIAFPFFPFCLSFFLYSLLRLKLARSCLGADGSAEGGKKGIEQISSRDGKIMTVALWVISRYSTYGELGIQ